VQLQALDDGRMIETCSAAAKKNMLHKTVSGETWFDLF
jgi:hypothetical protein